MNEVLSNLLDVYYSLKNLESIIKIKFDDEIYLPVPKSYVVAMILRENPEALEESYFDELEYSTKKLKRYDPISYFELQGTGRQILQIRKRYIVPLIKADNNANFNRQLSRDLISDAIESVAGHIESVAELISPEMIDECTEKLILLDENQSAAEIRESLLLGYYRSISAVLIDDPEVTIPDFEQFKKDIQTDDFKEVMHSEEVKQIYKHDATRILDIVASNPNISLEDLQRRLRNQKGKQPASNRAQRRKNKRKK